MSNLRRSTLVAASVLSLALGAQAVAQPEAKAPKTAAQWVPPGTAGSPIDATIFHAQVLLDVAGFPSGVIDGKKGMVFEQALRGFQQSKGLKQTGELDGPTRQALLQQDRRSTQLLELTDTDVGGPFVYPFPKKPEDQAKLKGLGYRNMLEKLAERFHTTPDTILALNGPDKLIGRGQKLVLPNILPQSRDYAGAIDDKQSGLLGLYNVDATQPQGNFIVVDKSEGVLRVYQGEVPAGAYSSEKNRGAPPKLTDNPGKLVAQFPVTMGSTHDPLPLGKWKVPTFAFDPPFHYQPNLFWDAKDKSADDKMLPPGPNGPVGVAWLDLTKEHYGIHGTPAPETIGRAESHGCIRMSNWDVIRLSRMMKPGFTAIFQG
ncbi:L,D-transpeptidase family protein [Sphingomonas astaxanthinifaciens]|uniref:Peptidoglycan-binding protein n=1 Tax=Sphingomonas astaxanthinifaciens DSM 22298 TaxID=1123267 RepID=A0ABQ5Z980_9SPHN|nr:L,D-transpeptidase family protein [Sphingomonas astaxanthinifaciens]GLR48546.1 peptidoglycan-binding protein [Sphingomonas astaxanthinifaciens DSM 22298]